MLLAARDVTSGAHHRRFVMINAILMQLYVPQLHGHGLSQIKQGLIDIETMFALLHETPEIVEAGRQALRSSGARSIRQVSSLRPERRLKDVSFECRGKMVAIVGRRVRVSHHFAILFVSMSFPAAG